MTEPIEAVRGGESCLMQNGDEYAVMVRVATTVKDLPRLRVLQRRALNAVTRAELEVSLMSDGQIDTELAVEEAATHGLNLASFQPEAKTP